MGRIRDKMFADLLLAGLSKSTPTAYLACASGFVKFHMRPSDQRGEAEARAFLLHLARDWKVAVGTYLSYLGELRLLYEVTLGWPEVVVGIPWPRMRRRPPDVLTRPEAVRVLDAAPSPYCRAFFTAAYGAGLRGMEVARLRAPDIDRPSGLLRVS